MNLSIREANIKAVKAMQSAQPVIESIQTAIDVVPRMQKNMILHAGPPITWDKMSGPMRGAVIGGLIYEKLAKDQAQAEHLASSGDIKFEPWHEHDGVGPMAGVATASMPVWVINNKTSDRKTFCTLNEGLGKVLRYGAFSDEVIERLNWIEKKLAPLLAEAIKHSPEINLKQMIAQALQMGDEVHNRNKAATSLLIRELAPAIVKSDFPDEDKQQALKFMHSNDHFFLNLSMPACKAMTQAAEWIEGSTIVTTMARNGTEFGIRVSGLKNKWFCGPANIVKGMLFPGFEESDCNPDIGDSAITETIGLGGFSMAAAPAIVKFVGGEVADAMNFTRKMYEICETESDSFFIPNLDFRGSPTGIDLLKVAQLSILPQINTGIAHKDPGVGQVGAGLVNPPFECFENALEDYVKTYCP